MRGTKRVAAVGLAAALVPLMASRAEAAVQAYEETHVLTFTDQAGATFTCKLSVGSFLETNGDSDIAHSTTEFLATGPGIDLRCLSNDLRLSVAWTDTAGGRHTSGAHATSTGELSINFDAVQPRPYRTTHDVIFYNCQADCTFHATTGPK